jgi:hypothetical protein
MISKRVLSKTLVLTEPCVPLYLESDNTKCVVEKVDLVMWTKNSAKLLPVVLRRIDQVIPKRVIGKKNRNRRSQHG